MKYEIRNQWTGELIYSAEADSWQQVIKEALKSGANLRGANLESANLWGANLESANLWGANLRGANLRGANLESANLRGANLRGANLRGANLESANLWGANLRSANLRGANLESANLWGANLEKTKLPSPTTVLLANWGTVSDQLCADLMEYDAWTHGDRGAFEQWVQTGVCPYADGLIQRAANFSERKSLFGTGRLRSPSELLKLLFTEKEIKR